MSLFTAHFVNSQVVVVQSTKKVVIEGRSYFIHDIKQGETLYSISKAYNVLQKDIKIINPEASETIKTGQELKIPIYETYTVKRGETLFSIAKRYEANLNEFFEINSELDSKDPKLSIGQQIRIPLAPFNPPQRVESAISSGETDTAKSPETPPVSPPQSWENPPPSRSNRDVLNIAMFLPLYIADNFPAFASDTTLIKTVEGGYKYRDGRYWINPRSVNALEFYQGALLALDSLKKQGLNAKIEMFDTMRDADRMAQLLRRPEMKDFDLYIGPFATELADIVSDFARKNNIFYVSPTAIMNAESLKNNPYMIQVNSAEINTVNTIVNFISNQNDINVILIGNRARFDQTLLNAYRNKLKTVFDDEILTVLQIHPDSMQQRPPSRYLKRGVTNVVIIPDADEVFVNNITGQLNASSNSFRINVYGLADWTKFVNLDLEYLHALEFRYATAFFIEYDKPEVKNFLKQYRTIYHTEPTMLTGFDRISPYQYQFAFLGYDVTFFFLSALKNYGENFGNILSDFKLNTLQSDFHFERIDHESGYKNSNFNIYRYSKDYSIVKEQ